MQLTVREVADILNVTERAVYGWIGDGMPCHTVDGQYRFNKSEILEWAHSRKLSVSTRIYRMDGSGKASTTVAEAIEAGGVVHGLAGHDKATVLRAMVNALKLPAVTDRDVLYEIVLAREKMGSTGIGNGIAIPHVRSPIVLSVRRPSITVCFLEHPIEYKSVDSLPVHTLFWLVTPSVRSHTLMLARLASLLQDSGFQAVLAKRGTTDEILSEVRRIEVGMPPVNGEAK